ncbi:M6 family metalloprotease domain-containing protein [Humisphaera borealis]|uniref:M6 family metalloprotease domain-containing protein n=1 Tax=Humisphaera borealis TaxID=2807512 RepID=A0A7M2X0V0_9BACT|nr:M6 family metalloprotease domain-containing protein [Humisphaera borealis]QOV91284.1 M6 family metalloprotease domain-containing protein [Humisphaera borealis]
MRSNFGFRALVCMAAVALPVMSALGQAPPSTTPASKPATVPAELPGFRTVATAETTKIKAPTSGTGSVLGYLGIAVKGQDGRVVVEEVDDHSPASSAGIVAGDVLTRINSTEIRQPSQVAESLLALAAGDSVKLGVVRDGKPKELSATLAPTSRPMKLSATRAIMGITLKESSESDGALLDRVTSDLPAAKAGLKSGDMITRIDDAAVGAMVNITEMLASYAPGDTITVRYRRGNETSEVKVTLVADPRAGTDVRSYVPANIFKKDVFRLAVITIEYPDTPRSDKITAKAWNDALFSSGTYTDKNATGQPVFGSMADYFREVSCGKLKVEGKTFDPVKVAKNRADYAAGTGDRRMLNEAIDLVLKRDGADSMRAFDGVLFLHCGGRVQTNRGNVFWPHRSVLLHQNRRYSYFICPESSTANGDRMNNISVFCHEFGHMIGLPDLYARPENPGSEGLGQWCLMSNQLGNGKPQHMSAWCKEQLGWLTPTVIDPTVKQKLVLSPIEGTTDQCFKILARPDGSEYFLLEVRKKTGFDIDLPGDGLLIWRVVRGRPILEESHGVDGPLGPRSYLRSVPFPTTSNHSFTPYTTPSSKSQLGGGMPVFITDIEKLPDGRVTFAVGYQKY